MKAAMNGVLNLSVLDGWWDEAPRDGTGFTMGDDTDGRTDDDVAAALYDRLENEVIPLFYDRPGGDRTQMPAAWVERMAAAASRLGRFFSSDRMLGDYLETSYAHAAARVRRLSEDGERGARELAAWKAKARVAWDAVDFASVTLNPGDPARLASGQTFRVEVQLRLGELGPEDLAVDWFEGEMDRSGGVDAGYSTPLAFVERRDGTATWDGVVTRPADDRRGYSVRVRPWHPLLSHPNETGLVLWAE
jgi:starch phosphorylase